MEFVIVLVVLVAVVYIVTGPLRAEAEARGQGGATDSAPAVDLGELEAARDAKYREIRDAQLDHATGKLSDEDFGILEDRLRAEALPILDAIERARQGRPEAGEADGEPG